MNAKGNRMPSTHALMAWHALSRTSREVNRLSQEQIEKIELIASQYKCKHRAYSGVFKEPKEKIQPESSLRRLLVR